MWIPFTSIKRTLNKHNAPNTNATTEMINILTFCLNIVSLLVYSEYYIVICVHVGVKLSHDSVVVA